MTRQIGSLVRAPPLGREVYTIDLNWASWAKQAIASESGDAPRETRPRISGAERSLTDETTLITRFRGEGDRDGRRFRDGTHCRNTSYVASAACARGTCQKAAPPRSHAPAWERAAGTLPFPEAEPPLPYRVALVRGRRDPGSAPPAQSVETRFQTGWMSSYPRPRSPCRKPVATLGVVTRLPVP